MKPSIPIRLAAAASALLLLASLAGCAKQNATPAPLVPQYHTPNKLPSYTLTQDTTDYRALALATFDNTETAPAEAFEYETTEDGGIRLTAYAGNGGTVILPDTIDGKPVTALGVGLFADSETVTALSIPNSVTSIEEDLLTGCRTIRVLRTPQLGATREDAGYLAYFFGADTPKGMGFKVPSSLDTLILSDGFTKLDASALLDCSRLRMVLLPDTLTEIGDFALSGCSQLHFVPLPKALTTIGRYAFSGCSSLVSMEIGDGVTQIGLGALMGCQSLQQLTIPFVGESRDAKTASLGHIFGAETYTHNAGYVPKSLCRVTLTQGNVPDYAFYHCLELAEVVLAPSCERIGVRAFFGCANLRDITLPDSLRSIGELAFAHCTGMSGVSFNQTLSEIGMQAFMDCYNLTEITLPDSLTALPASAFADCRCLKTVTLGKNLTAIGAQAFRNCSSLTTVNGANPALQISQGNEYLAQILYPAE